jgi:CubicO group peptidase (beta-lactamase class C family)
MNVLSPATIVLYLISLFSLLGCSSTPSKTINQQNSVPLFKDYQDIGMALSEELNKEYLAGTFEGTVLIASNQKMLLNYSYGWAQRENKLKNSNRTISDMGSIAKTFTAAAVLQLVSNGKLKLDDTIGDFYPEAPIDKKRLTIEQLLSHSSGMDNFHNKTDFDKMNKAEALKKILEMPVIARPDEKIAYSNAAYTLLAAIVEQRSGQLFQRYIHQNILTPLSLSDTGFYGATDIPDARLTHGYGGVDNGSTTFEKGLTWALVGQGGMVTSTNDLYAWFDALLQGKIFPDNAQNLTFLTANEKWKLGNIRHFDSWGPQILHMGGSTDYGYTALIQYIPEYQVVIVMLLNAYNEKYAQATHQEISKNHIVPILVKGESVLKVSND